MLGAFNMANPRAASLFGEANLKRRPDGLTIWPKGFSNKGGMNMLNIEKNCSLKG